MARASLTRNFLFTTWEGGGSVAPALTVVARLVSRGHRVRVMSDLCNQPEAVATGATFIPWTQAPSRPNRRRATDILRDWDVAEPIDGLGRLLDQIMIGPALGYAEDVMAELRREPADLVVSSEMLPGVSAGCEVLDQPLALLAVNLSLFPVPGIPPLGAGLAPPKTPEDRALHDKIRADTIAYFDRRLPALNNSRKILGLVPLASLMEHPFRCQKLLMATARAFDFAPPSLPDKMIYVGPQLGEPSWAAPLNLPWAEDDPRPLAAVCFSTSFQNHVDVLQRVADAISSLPMRGVITLGDTIEPSELSTGENVLLLHSASHDALMKKANMVVTHGGHGTVMRALFHGRPLLVIPHGRDQNDNAVRVTERRAGLSLPTSASVDTIVESLMELKIVPSYASAAKSLGERIATEIKESPIIQELEALACRDNCSSVRRHVA